MNLALGAVVKEYLRKELNYFFSSFRDLVERYNVLVFVSVCLLAVGCRSSSDKNNAGHPTPGFNYLQQIPDSLRRSEQKRLVGQLLELTIEHVEVVDNHLVFTMSKDEFKQTGIPIEYYWLFKKSMNEANNYIEENNIQHVEKMIEEYHRNTRQVLQEKYHAPGDTIYFELQPAMIQKAWIEKIVLPRGDRYRVNVQLKDRYRDNYARATEKSIGKIFALTYHGDILTSPTVHTKITSGRTAIGIFKSRDQAEKIKKRIMGKGEW